MIDLIGFQLNRFWVQQKGAMWWIIESKEKDKEEVEEYKEKDKEEVEENGKEEDKEKDKEEDKEKGKLIVESRSRAYVWAKYWVILREELRNKKI